jgi:hypothetical protein
MNTDFPSEKIIPEDDDGGDEEASPILTELGKKTQFFHFLQKEMSVSKTETEKEAVLAILLKTKIQMRALEREWRQLQALSRASLRDAHAFPRLATPQQIQ